MPIAFVSGGLLSRTLPPNRRNKTLCAPTNFHLPAVLRTQRTLGGSGTPQEIPGHLPRVRSAFAGAAGSSALRWPPLRSWPLVGFEGPERSWRQELQVGHARKFSTHYFDFRHHRHFDRSTALIFTRSLSVSLSAPESIRVAREAESRPAAAYFPFI